MGPQTIIGDGIADDIGALLRGAGSGQKALVITDEGVAALHLEAVRRGLEAGGFEVRATAIAAGEQAKTLDQAGRLYEWLLLQRAERKDTVVALGGGVVGDLAGFVAATYLRGLPLVQVPTTLVAQIDSSIGGKVAINLPHGKNLVGAFYPARVTIIDTAFLDTLPPRELSSGWAEVIKTALLFDPPLFERVEAAKPEGMSRAEREDVVARCVRWKEAIVREDPREEGRRVLLNLGHTVGHALEVATGYAAYLHGEAVAIGLVAAARLSAGLGLLDSGAADRIEQALAGAGLPVRYTGTTPEALVVAAQVDKKVERAALRWILLRDVGSPLVERDVPESLVLDVLAGLRRAS